MHVCVWEMYLWYTACSHTTLLHAHTHTSYKCRKQENIVQFIAYSRVHLRNNDLLVFILQLRLLCYVEIHFQHQLYMFLESSMNKDKSILQLIAIFVYITFVTFSLHFQFLAHHMLGWSQLEKHCKMNATLISYVYLLIQKASKKKTNKTKKNL